MVILDKRGARERKERRVYLDNQVIQVGLSKDRDLCTEPLLQQFLSRVGPSALHKGLKIILLASFHCSAVTLFSAIVTIATTTCCGTILAVLWRPYLISIAQPQ
jgi:hypothetical protein